MNPLLLCIQMEPARQMRIAFTAMSLGIRVIHVSKEQWGQSLASLCGLEPAKKESVPIPKVEKEMLVMAFFPDQLLDAFLKSLRAGGQTVQLKAVLTPTNQHWNCGQLYWNLSQEAEHINKSIK